MGRNLCRIIGHRFRPARVWQTAAHKLFPVGNSIDPARVEPTLPRSASPEHIHDHRVRFLDRLLIPIPEAER